MTREEKPAGGASPLPEMMETLTGFTEDDWGLYAFAKEPLRGRFTREERIAESRAAAACGRQTAQKLIGDGPRLSAAEYAARYPVRIERKPMPDHGGYVLFAQYREPDRISLFTDCLSRLSETLERFPSLPVRRAEDVEPLLLAHELFHYLEYSDAAMYTRTRKLTLWKLGPLKHESTVECLSEIAAMTFAQALTGSPIHPFVLDVLLVFGYDEGAAENLYRGILRTRGV